MYNIEGKQYVLRQSTGDTRVFYHDSRYGLCYMTLTKRNVWSNPVTLSKSIYQSFHADIDSEDRFHIIFQDLQGNITYMLVDKDIIKTIPILNSKTPQVYNKHLFLVPTKNMVHFFYVLQRDSAPILAHQTLGEGAISNPKVIDYVTDSNKPFSVTLDKAQNMMVFYQSSDGKYLQLGYKRYNSNKKNWSEFVPVTQHDANSEYPEIVADSEGSLHLCYQRNAQKQFELIYIQKGPDKKTWSNETVIHTSSHSFVSSSIFWVNDNVIIFWVRDDIIYYSLGSQSGSMWDKPSKYNFPTNMKLSCLTYKTNNVYEVGKIFVKDIPGSLTGGLRFAFYQQPPENGENLSSDELRSLILDSLKLLKDGLQDLKEEEAILKEDLTRLTSRQEELEKDIVKCTVKLDLIEAQTTNIKSLNKRLDSITSELNTIKSRLPPKEDSQP